MRLLGPPEREQSKRVEVATLLFHISNRQANGKRSLDSKTEKPVLCVLYTRTEGAVPPGQEKSLFVL